MKVSVFSESPADEAALFVLGEAVVRKTFQRIDGPRLKGRGWGAVLDLLPKVVQHLYFRTDAEGLLVVLDSNGTAVHQPEHEKREETVPTCRLCRLRDQASAALRQLSPVPGRVPPKIALGLAVPAIEAWYRCGLDPHVGEASWIQGVDSGRPPYTANGLKRAVYGTDRPSLALETRRAIEEARRLAGDLRSLRTMFPGGFGALDLDLSRW